MGNSYKDLEVWKKAVELSVLIYELTDNFPRSEIYGLTNQTRKSALSIALDIAEGSKRYDKKEFHQF